MEGDPANVTLREPCHPRPHAKGDIAPDGDHVALHAMSPFIISHWKFSMGNDIKELFKKIRISI